MRVLTTDEVQEAEQQALLRPGMSQPVLIQRAGHAVTQFCLSHFKFRSVCVVCGTGRNGARGLVAAESLGEIAENVLVIVLAKDAGELDENTAAFCARLSRKPIWISAAGDFQAAHVQEALQADLIIDAIEGDAKVPLGALQKKAVEAVNDAFGTIVSIDVPSGVDPDATLPLHQTEHDAIFAHGIITFVAPRPAHVFGELTSGPVALSEIGVQPALVSNKSELQVITGQEVGMAFPSRSPDAHKGSFGHVLVIAGAAGKAGAAALAGMAALRTGAGLVTIACPKSIQTIVANFAPELMTEALPETETGSLGSAAGDVIDKLMAGKDVVVLGPGLSQHPETAQLVRGLVGRCKLPLVLDADGINAFAERAGELKPAGAMDAFRVLTPHPGEAARLLGISTKEIQSDRPGVARRIASVTGSCVVLKGWRTVVAGASGETWINMSGNPALAKGGSGDVLSGMIGAALARQPAHSPSSQRAAAPELQAPRSWMHEIYGTDSMEKERKYRAQQLESNTAKGATFLKDVSVAGAVHLHGMAGDMARDELHENTVIARDVMDNLSEAFHECELQMERGLFYLQK
jgi:ADP-dependent NAD(P)H-hydrate dehydratase / NAD(P)H-hydrate epimerase